MNSQSNLWSFIVFMGGAICLFAACSKGPNPDISSNVPYVKVNVTINIYTSAYTTLTKVGGQAYVSGGNRGLILCRVSSSTIVAFDRTCTYNIGDANGIVQGQTDGTAICLECQSEYNLTNGGVNAGPTTIGLKEYNVSFNSTSGSVTITN